MTILGGLLLYLGLIGAFAGLLSVVIPIRFLGIRTRKRGLVVFGLALLIFVAGVYLPVDYTYVIHEPTALDKYVPVYQFHEFHSVLIHASQEQVYAAIHQVTPAEIRYYNTLMRIRGLRPGLSTRPILTTFTSGMFKMLADDPNCEILFGREGQPVRNHRDEFIKIAMNFRMRVADPVHTLLTSETRVYTEGWQTVHGFAAYWRMIYPGSSLIRRMWLRAIQIRAEAASAASLSALH